MEDTMLVTENCGCLWQYRHGFDVYSKSMLKPCTVHEWYSPISVYVLDPRDWARAANKHNELHKKEKHSMKCWIKATMEVTDGTKRCDGCQKVLLPSDIIFIEVSSGREEHPMTEHPLTQTGKILCLECNDKRNKGGENASFKN